MARCPGREVLASESLLTSLNGQTTFAGMLVTKVVQQDLGWSVTVFQIWHRHRSQWLAVSVCYMLLSAMPH